MVAYTRLQQRKNEESEKLSGGGDKEMFTNYKLREVYKLYRYNCLNYL